jgi:hypothetical protein
MVRKRLDWILFAQAERAEEFDDRSGQSTCAPESFTTVAHFATSFLM